MANLETDLARFIPMILSGNNLDLRSDEMTLAREGSLSVHWIPSDHLAPRTTRLAIVGISPGRTQAEIVLNTFATAIRAGRSCEVSLRDAKHAGSFAGAMRAHLTEMLDFIGVQKVYGIPTCSTLFDPQNELVHFTSALRYPVFVNEQNYRGSPSLLRRPLLRGIVEKYLAAEIRALPHASWLSLGPEPAVALRHLVSLGVLSADAVLEGMPHPSGANNERIAYFLGQKPKAKLSSMTPPDPIDRARENLIGRIAHLRRV